MKKLRLSMVCVITLLTGISFAEGSSPEPSDSDDDSTTVRYWLSLSVQVKDPEVKIEYLTRAIEIDPENEDALYRRGIAYDDSKEYENAVKDFTKALKHAGKDPYVYNARAISYKNMEDFESAIKDLNTALNLAEKNKLKAALYLNRGQIHKAMGKKKQALSDFKKVRTLVMGGPIFMNAITEINKLKD